MTSTSNYGTIVGSTYGISIAPQQADTRPKTPAGLKEIVWESDAEPEGEDAVKTANARVVEVLRALFRRPAERDGSTT